MALVALMDYPADVISLIPIDDKAVGRTGQTLRNQFEEDRTNKVRSSILNWERFLLLKAKQQLCALTKLEANWDSYGAPAPNQTAVVNTVRVLEALQPYELGLARILPSAEGGVGICFVNGNRYADIECSNDGEMIGVRYVGTEMPILIDINESGDAITAALEQIRTHLGA
jgi:hypothetical protein